MASAEPLEALKQLSQDFPKYSAAIARKVSIPPNVRQKASEMMYRDSASQAIYINGKAFQDHELNAYSYDPSTGQVYATDMTSGSSRSFEQSGTSSCRSLRSVSRQSRHLS